ncbi:B3 DNA binding domain-containing protein [Tanacetum coccineum]
MAAPIFKAGTKNPNSAETSHSRPPTICAPSSRMQRNLNLSRFNVLEEDQPAPLKIVGSDPSSHPSLSLQKRSLAVMKAKEFQSTLGSDFPSCYKMMVRLYVTSGSSLGLPTDFCKSHLPKNLPNDVHFVLEDEKRVQWEVKYFPYNFRISAGWKKFVDAHKLVEGDVYIIKANNGIEVDGSLSLMNVETQAEQMALVASTSRLKRREHTESLSLTVVPKKPRTHRVSFNIVYRGLCIDNELSDDMRSSYYRLCSQKKQLLHDGLPEGLYTKLVVGMIGQTVNIAAKIKNTKLNTTKEELENWDNILKAFELLGMKVAFLRDKIHLLATFLSESEAAPDIQSYTESKCEIERVEREIPKLKGRLKTLKETAKCTKVLDSFRRKVEPYENIFKEAAAVPCNMVADAEDDDRNMVADAEDDDCIGFQKYSSCYDMRLDCLMPCKNVNAFLWSMADQVNLVWGGSSKFAVFLERISDALNGD